MAWLIAAKFQFAFVLVVVTVATKNIACQLEKVASVGLTADVSWLSRGAP
jgi:hypothetical protein